MSQYNSIEGYFIFLDESKYIEIRNKLIQGSWIGPNGDFADEGGGILLKNAAPIPLANSIKYMKELNGEPAIKTYLLQIPRSGHRNLGRILNDIIETSNYYWFIDTCVDGCNDGSFGKHFTETYFCDLEGWAKENKIKMPMKDYGDGAEYIVDNYLLENKFWDKYDSIFPDVEMLKEATFYLTPKKINGEIVIGEYKTKYLVDTPETTILVPKIKVDKNDKITARKTKPRKVNKG
jgi:hypothetical protein